MLQRECLSLREVEVDSPVRRRIPRLRRLPVPLRPVVLSQPLARRLRISPRQPPPQTHRLPLHLILLQLLLHPTLAAGAVDAALERLLLPRMLPRLLL